MLNVTLILCICLIVWEGFITFNSLQIGHQSEARSRRSLERLFRWQSQAPQWFKAVVTKIFRLLHRVFDPLYPQLRKQNETDFEHFLIRKAAHMTQFFILACLWFWLLISLNFSLGLTIFATLSLVLFASVIDEFIQHFIPNRSASVIDVLVDFSGGLLATSIFTCFMLLY